MHIIKYLLNIRRRVARTSTQRLIEELAEQRNAVEIGFFCSATPVQRLEAAAALNSMKAIINQLRKNASLECTVKGTQAEDLPDFMERGRRGKK